MKNILDKVTKKWNLVLHTTKNPLYFFILGVFVSFHKLPFCSKSGI